MDYNKIALEKCIEKNNYPKNWGWGEITSYTNKKWLKGYYISETEQEECEKVKKKNKFVNKFKKVVLSQRNDET